MIAADQLGAVLNDTSLLRRGLRANPAAKLPSRVEQADAESMRREPPCGGESGEPAADDADVFVMILARGQETRLVAQLQRVELVGLLNGVLGLLGALRHGFDAPVATRQMGVKRSSHEKMCLALRPVDSRADCVLRNRRVVARQPVVVQGGRVHDVGRPFVLHRAFVNVVVAR